MLFLILRNAVNVRSGFARNASIDGCRSATTSAHNVNSILCHHRNCICTWSTNCTASNLDVSSAHSMTLTLRMHSPCHTKNTAITLWKYVLNFTFLVHFSAHLIRMAHHICMMPIDLQSMSSMTVQMCSRNVNIAVLTCNDGSSRTAAITTVLWP